MSARRLLLATALAAALPFAALAAASPSGASARPPSSVHVATSGTDSSSCGSAASPCKTITYALGRAGAGGSILVGPGTYTGQLVVTSPVTITGSGPSTVIDPSSVPVADTDTDSSTPQYADVDVTSDTGRVTLADLTVDGAGASASFTSCADDYVGVYFHSASGSLEDVAVEGVALTGALSSCPEGVGVYVTDASSAPVAVTIDHSSVTGYQSDGIICDDTGVSCAIDATSVTGIGPTPTLAQDGIQIWSASADVEDSTITQNSYTDPDFDPDTFTGYEPAIGIRVLNAGTLRIHDDTVTGNDDNVYLLADSDPSSGLTLSSTPVEGLWLVTGDNLSGAVNNSAVPPGGGIGDSLDIDSTTAKVVAAGDNVSDSPEFGVAVLGATGAVVSDDVDHDGSVAFFAAGPGTAGTFPSDDVFSGDTATDSQLFGFYVYPGVSDVTFSHDFASGSGVDDVVDMSTGSGTAGTANEWIDDACTTSSPTGLCSAHRLGGHPGPWVFGTRSNFPHSPAHFGRHR